MVDSWLLSGKYKNRATHMIKIISGYDRREPVGYHVFCHSVLSRTSAPVSFTPLNITSLKEYFWRERTKNESTDFSFSRFLSPFLQEYKGWVLFCDGADMLCLSDIAELWEMRDESKAVMVVKNDHSSDESTKFLGQKQTHYPRKNWSSLMLINCPMWRDIGVMEANSVPGKVLHRFEWIDDSEIGELPLEWNHLVGVSPPRDNAKLVHFTLAAPFFRKPGEVMEYDDKWNEEYLEMTYAQDATWLRERG